MDKTSWTYSLYLYPCNNPLPVVFSFFIYLFIIDKAVTFFLLLIFHLYSCYKTTYILLPIVYSLSIFIDHIIDTKRHLFLVLITYFHSPCYWFCHGLNGHKTTYYMSIVHEFFYLCGILTI